MRPAPSPSLISDPLAVVGDQRAAGDRQRREHAVDGVTGLDGITGAKADDVGGTGCQRGGRQRVDLEPVPGHGAVRRSDLAPPVLTGQLTICSDIHRLNF